MDDSVGGPIHLELLLLTMGIEKFTKKLLRESNVTAILQKLDRLTLEEAWVTVAPTLKVIHGLLNSLKVVIDGEQAFT